MGPAGETEAADRIRPHRALLGVADRTGMVAFATGLARGGVELVATGGTAAALRASGLAVRSVEDVTGVAPMLDGRVKTLHPAIHGGILFRRDDPAHVAEIESRGILPIDLVCVNLYPFSDRVAGGATAAQALEAIDIGGPTLLRAAAKTHPHVTVVSHPDQYGEVLAALATGGVPAQLRRRLAAAAFAHTSAYDSVIAHHLATPGAVGEDSPASWPAELTVGGPRIAVLRYGENPHQGGALYRVGATPTGLAAATLHQGSPLSFTNWLDCDAAWATVRGWPEPAAVVIKHTNPCGFATAETIAAAFQLARACDPRSAYGGIVGCNRPIDETIAGLLAEGFLEAVVAPAATPSALERLAGRRRLRILTLPPSAAPSDPAGSEAPPLLDVRSIAGALLVQTPDPGGPPPHDWRSMASRPPTASEQRDLAVAWHLVQHVRSNAIVLARDGQAIGIGAGQMSRVEAAELAVRRAGERSRGSVLASDAFIPMPDTVAVAIAAGVTAIVQPGGSVQDPAVTAAADGAGLAILHSGRRHFRH
ncbi:MAG TPA: bifunctional phosphoribosylaminoimidazolecarboxamide formyltransferase/IMP cyclohydrolase [Verrucomicrobiae bacterium]|nr:bifunctional phosphoribosylaminoimidazolecarboxamide formyltransferase/IMP cyclohydrolase [Verrucomicrobiae bacterium]